MDEAHSEAAGQSPRDVGTRLAEARAKQKLSLEDIAARSRIPLRHLQAIEEGRHGSLPAATYSVGFVRTYAQLLGLDSTVFARDFRAEIGSHSSDSYAYEPFEPADPTRVPSRMLAIGALVIAGILLAGFLAWRGGMFGGDNAEQRAALAAGVDTAGVGGGSEDRAVTPPAVPPPAASATAPADNTVLLTATEPVWVRVSQKTGERLLEKTMAAGESWQVPATADAPKILTGRPQALRITVGGKVIPPLGPPEHTVKGASLLPASLLARTAVLPAARRDAAPPPARRDNAAAPSDSVDAAVSAADARERAGQTDE
ncbi:MAG TPA: RodZ domain-containing protein [Sphingomonadaceae bacterium]|nr:RodZ domain-containing protein [Sphingomonadaceae bacterium]